MVSDNLGQHAGRVGDNSHQPEEETEDSAGRVQSSLSKTGNHALALTLQCGYPDSLFPLRNWFSVILLL